MAKELTFNLRSASTLTEDILHKLAYFEGDKAAIPYIWRRGRGSLVVVTGENAGGKSFFRRLVQIACKRSKIECMTISMEGRQTGGPWNAFIYGSERWEATGQNSAQTILNGITTCRSREHTHVIFWDEPDLGLSESWAAGAGQAIRDFMLEKPSRTRAAFVVSHSRSLIRQLLPVRPHYLYLGSTSGPPTLKDWVEHQPKPRSLADLPKESHKRFKAIQKILDGVKA